MPSTVSNISLPYQVSEHLPIAIYQCDTAGNITSYNQAAIKLWGRIPDKNSRYTGAHAIYNAAGQSLSLEDHPVARTLRTGVNVDGEELIIERPDGGMANVMAYCVPVLNELKIVTGAVNTFIDITEQRSGEHKQEILAAIIETSDDAIISKTLDGVITSWNNGAQELFGYTADEIIGKSITIIVPDSRLNEEREIISRIKLGEKVDHFSTFRLHKSGQEIPVSLAISPIKNLQGNIIGASKIARNITRQLQADNRLQQYAENLEIFNYVGKVVSENLDVQEILQKVTDATTLLTGAAYGAFFYNDTDENGEFYTLYTLSGASREAFEHLGVPRKTKLFSPTFNGTSIIRVDDITKHPRYGQNSPHYGMPLGHLPVVSYLAAPVISKNGEVIGALFLGHPQAGMFDAEHETLVTGVSSQASIALDNAKLYEEVQQLNAKKDEFIGLASHELKTPVTSINGYLQIIDRNLFEGDRNKTFVKKAIAQIGKLSDLISDLLDVSKIESGQLPLNYTHFNVANLVDDVTEIIQYSTKTHRIIICSKAGDININADKQRIEQVIINLLSNAIKYSPQADHVNITVSKNDDTVSVEVQDFGIGISKEQQQRIFSRFYRVDDVASHISGLGIGLYISNEIVKRHKGLLSVTSSIGKGSIFKFEIPNI